jgi:hypothetical protein
VPDEGPPPTAEADLGDDAGPEPAPDAAGPDVDAAPPETDGGASTDGATSSADAAPGPAPDAGAPAGVRFVLRVTNDVPESIWVQVSDAAGQPGWLTLEHAGERFFIAEMCEFETCDGPPEGVCGAALPMVRDITGGTARGEHVLEWDGIASRPDRDGTCERRGPAPAGTWKATFCWGLAASVESSPVATEAVPGEVLRPVCVERHFELPGTREVVEVLAGG